MEHKLDATETNTSFQLIYTNTNRNVLSARNCCRGNAMKRVTAENRCFERNVIKKTVIKRSLTGRNISSLTSTNQWSYISQTGVTRRRGVSERREMKHRPLLVWQMRCVAWNGWERGSMKGKLGDVTDGPPRAGCPLAEIRVITVHKATSPQTIFS